MKTKQTFEAAFQRIDEISRLLENAALPLDESMKLYTEATTLIAFCSKQLEEATLIVEKVQKTENGESDNEPAK